ncbi:MAG: aminotransferase class IV family protein [Prolixibacteraceae bacterium]|jgi:4-amino-4-deoxychorismate lyase|nr:aminotransferase class IV family protein [Prolixibacteraceae bacterium]
MYRLLETIKLENGVLCNLAYHNLRFNHARHMLFGIREELKLETIIRVPDEFNEGLYRCRVLYSGEIEKIEFIPYLFRNIRSLKIVTDDQIEYSYKFADRRCIDKLFEKREDCDEIIIVKNGLVTDCSVGNLIFHDGRKWWTPFAPLLKGTRRMQLLEEGAISEKEIRVEDIFSFRKAAIINVFYGLESLPEIPVANIR